MPLTEAQKRYYEKNREKLLAYKSKYWQENKHKYNHKKPEQQSTITDAEGISPESKSD